MAALSTARAFLRRALGMAEETPAAPQASSALEDAPQVDAEFADMLADLGAEPSEPAAPLPGQASEAADPAASEDPSGDLRDLELAELRSMLAKLQPLGDELARVEQERLSGLEREGELVAELERAREELRVERRERRALERRLRQREGVLARERKRHAQTREKYEQRRAQAIERWHQLREARNRLRELEGS